MANLRLVTLRRDRRMHPILRLALHRALLAAVLVLVVSAVTFVLLSVAPGDPAATLLGGFATPAKIAQVRRELGLEKPLWQQYWDWLDQAAHGSLGSSLVSQEAVFPELMGRLPVTLSLVVGTTLVSAVVGVGVGAFSAVRGGLVGRFLDVVSMLGFALPSFWLGLVLMELFAVQWGLLPATGYVSFGDSPLLWLRSLVLPVATLSIGGVTGIAKQTRDALLSEWGKDYVDALRATGLSERRILLRHALKNAAIPIVTVVGVYFVGMLGGAVLVENIFAMPGLGSLATSSTGQGDIPVVLGIAVLFCLIVVLVNFLVDLAYGLLNPRARAA
ncbi:ABC transporter permease [Streptomyces sp. NBC_00582]|uniref:ABC transporter permease n=1 Tax=Streptomyces sp. NBC_00582 TaxID=2975783 RepID=UPI002E800552|nr:ABC transporter permease [Streptomyces sp. NBC_00582]WUB67561.1 ABC transporter permease [Streptomyces sp. NBC_00582]